MKMNQSNNPLNELNPNNPIISSYELKEDIDSCVTAIQEAHADPYRNISKQRFSQIVKNLKHYIEALKTDRFSIFECYYFLQELVTSIQDEHTFVLPTQSRHDTMLTLPFSIKLLHDKVFVIKRWVEMDIPLGSEILAINTIPMKSIIARYWKFLSPPLQHSKRIMFERTISDSLQTYFQMTSPWTITYRHNSQLYQAEIKGISIEKGQYPFMAELSLPYTESSFTVDIEKVPILEIPSFSYGDEQVYQNFIDDFFKRYFDSNYLVIDLRQNPGGSGSRGTYLLDHFTDSKYLTYESFQIKVSELFRSSEYKFKAGKQLEDVQNGSFIESVEEKRHLPHNKNKYGGKVFLFTSPYTGSAAVVTSAIFKFNKMGTIIGQETFGRKRFCSDPVFYKLPHTKLHITIPLAIMTLVGGNPDRGVIPDIKIIYEKTDYVNRTDKEMDQVKEIIRKEGKS
jgi:hypothetical protein